MGNIMDSYIQGINGMGNNQTTNNEKEGTIMSNQQTANNEKEGTIMSNQQTANNEKEDTIMSNQQTANNEKEGIIMSNQQTANNEKEGTIMSNNSETAMADNQATNEVQENGLALKTEQSTISITLAPKSINLLVDSIDECDRAVEVVDQEHTKLKAMWDKVTLSEYLRDMVNIRNVLNDKIYVGLHENEKGERQIDYCQMYNDGRFSPKMSVSQADMIMAIKIRANKSDKQDKSVTKMADRFFIKAGKDYLGKFRGGVGEAFDIEEIMDALYVALPHLKVAREDSIEWSRTEFYDKLVPILKTLSIQTINDHKSYYIFSRDEIDGVAYNMKLKQIQLLQKLKEYGLLYLTESSRGFQTNVRFRNLDGSTYTSWMYCVYNLDYLAGIREDDSDVASLDEF